MDIIQAGFGVVFGVVNIIFVNMIGLTVTVAIGMLARLFIWDLFTH